MGRTNKGHTIILCALICTVLIAILGIKDAKSINAKTPDDTTANQVKEITIVTVTPKQTEEPEYIDFDLDNLTIVRKEGEDNVVNSSGTPGDGESAAATEDPEGDESGTTGYSDDNSRNEQGTGEPVGSEVEYTGDADEPKSVWESEPMSELVESESGDATGSEGSVDEYAGSSEDEFGDGYSDVSEMESGLTYLGAWVATGYCPGSCCCGEYASGYTASGTLATEGITVACNSLPFGTQLMIDGNVYTVEDTGWSPYGENWVDIFFYSHDSALAFGMREVEVYLVN